MKKEQLLMYAGNQRGSLFNTVIVAVSFLILKYQMYGFPKGQNAQMIEGGVLVFCLVMLLRQRETYYRILNGKIRDSECGGYIARIAINRLLYIVPWLFLLFQPLQSSLLYHHLIGYLFVFCLTAAYSSASAPVPFLLLFDIGLPALVALGVTYLNWNVQETRYVGAAILFFCIYVFFTGRKIGFSTLQLIESKNQSALSARRADEANKAKSRFLALMSHEIRTPMTGIFGMLDFLKETPLNDEQRDFVLTISDCSKTLLNTLNDILDFSKVESGKLNISEVNFDFHAMIGNSARLLRQVAEDKGLKLNLEVAPDVPAKMRGDPHRIQQIVVNLLNNAVKFTEKGSVSLRAKFIPGPPAMMRVEVIDTGIGIGKENIGKLFTAFTQADNSISRKYGGSGLGLSIARKLVELMAGKIDVISEEGKGSTFWFEIPYHKPLAGAEEDAEGAETNDVPPKYILVVEDNAISQRVIIKMLSHKGHQVSAVCSGDEAIKAVQESPFDLIFMDVNLPGRNGLDTTRAIRKLGGRAAETPIVGLTANIMEEYIRKCHEAGMVAHIGKPFSPKNLYDAVATYAGGKAVKKQKPKPKTMRETLAAVRDAMGIEYMRDMVATNLKEADRLMDLLQEEYEDGVLDSVGNVAHDLKSITGLIGMNDTSAIAAAIELDCLNADRRRLPDLLYKLGRMKAAEATEAQRVASTMREA